MPFFKTVAIFFVLFPGAVLRESVWSVLFKCSPIVSLIAFVLMHGMSLSEFHSYSRRIVAGLVFSIIGDAFLVYSSKYFMHGLVMFAIGHMFYTVAFGFRPLRLARLPPLVVAGGLVYGLLLPGLPSKLVWPTLVYMCCIGVMLWRAVSRVEFSDGLWTWTSMCSFLGAISFIVSDMAIAIVKFRFSFPYSDLFIMSTYYFAQCGIALSVVDVSMASKHPDLLVSGWICVC